MGKTTESWGRAYQQRVGTDGDLKRDRPEAEGTLANHEVADIEGEGIHQNTRAKIAFK